MKFILALCFLFSACFLQAQTDTAKFLKTDSAVYYRPDIKADYPGGTQAWLHYLQKNMRYPDKAVDKNIQGTVIVQFMVDSAGTTHDVTAISGPEELREESIRLIKQSDSWVPAMNNGKKVNSWEATAF